MDTENAPPGPPTPPAGPPRTPPPGGEASWSRARWPVSVGVAGVVGAVVIGWILAWKMGAPALRDFNQLDEAAAYLAKWRFGDVYGATRLITSPPAYLYMMVYGSKLFAPWFADPASPYMANCPGFLSSLRCNGPGIPIGMLSLAGCVAAVVWTLSGLRVGLRSAGAVVAAAATSVNLAVIACLSEYWHPQDLVAGAASVVGVGATMRRRPVLAGVAFGVAVTTRQTAVLVAVAALAAFVPARSSRDQETAPWRPLVAALAAGAAVAIVLCGPFVVTDPGAFFSQLGARALYRSPQTLAARLPDTASWVLARLGPLVLAGAGTAVVIRRARRGPVSDTALLGMSLALAASRALMEPAPFTYYLAPAVLLLIVWEARRGFPVLSTLAGVLGLLVSQSDWARLSRTSHSVLPAAAIGPAWFLLGGGMVALGLWVWWTSRSAGSSAEPTLAEPTLAEPGVTALDIARRGVSI